MIKIADKLQIEFYEKKLYPIQDLILTRFDTDYFYLTGGTALSRFYYKHRYSEDLDFFFDGYKHNSENFDVQFRKIIYKIERLVDKIEIPIENEFFKRVFVIKAGVELKIEFIFEKYKTVGEKKFINNFFVDTKENICANKITAVQDRKTFKDFFDLFFLLKEIPLNKAVEWSKYKIVPLDYEGIILAFDNAFNKCEGDVLSIVDVSNEELRLFISELIDELINNAKTT